MKEKILDLLAELCEDDIVQEDLDVDMISTGLLDSLAYVELLIGLEDICGLKIAMSELDREEVGTPRKLLEYVEGRLK